MSEDSTRKEFVIFKRPPGLLYGILSIFVFPILLIVTIVLASESGFPTEVQVLLVAASVVSGPIFGVMAWMAARRNLKTISEVPENAASRMRFRIGRVLGVIGTVLMTPFYIVLLTYFSQSGRSFSDSEVSSDIEEIAAHAFEYRIRLEGNNGGGGSYREYELPNFVRENENGRYSVHVFHDDSLMVFGTSWFDTTRTVTAVVGPDGEIVRKKE